jgi:type IV pilus assembly protein PilA
MIIIGILAAIAIPVFLNQRAKGWDSAVKSDLKNAATGQETFLTDNGNYSSVSDATELEGFNFSAAANYTGAPAITTVLYTGATPAAIAATEVAGVGGYCLTAVSASGEIEVYNSLAGGLQPAAVDTCIIP